MGYENYRDAKVTWLGSIPAHWDVRRTKANFSFRKGLSITKADLKESGIAVISCGQVHSKTNTGVRLSQELIRYVDESYLATSHNALVERGDFIFADTSEDIAGCGNCAYVDWDGDIFAGYHTIIAHNKETSDNKYFAYLFQAPLWRSQIRSEVNGVKVYSITQEILKSTYIIVPPKDEQDQIALFLDWKITAIDKLTAIRREELRNLADLRKALITREVTRGNWERVRLKRVCDVTLGKMVAPYPSSDADTLEEYVCAKDVHFDGVNLDNLKKMWFRPNEKEQYRIYDGDLLVVEGGSVGNCAIATNLRGRSVYVQNSIHIIRPKDDKVIMPYVCYCLQYLCNTGYMKTVSNVATIAHYTKQKVLATPIPLPPITEQIRIANYLDKICTRIDSAITNFTQQIETLRELKARMIFDVVTGRIDVRQISVPQTDSGES